MHVRVVLWAWLGLFLPVVAFPSDLIQNGSFETNGGPNSNLMPGWSIVDEVGGSGTWVAQTGKIGPVTTTCGPDDVEAPPDGTFAAMTTQAAEGSHVLYQDVMIPAGATPLLTFQYFIRSSSRFWTPDSLSFSARPNQQFRVDIIDPASNPFTLDVLQNVLIIGDGNPVRFGYETHAVVLTGFGGRTVRLRFAEVDTQGCFYAGVDHVRLETSATNPPPAIVRFTAVPASVRFAGSSTLSWTTQNATSVEIDNGVGTVAVNGSVSVSLQAETTFTLTATGPAGTVRRTVTVSVEQPGPSIEFSATPSFIEKAQTATLTWSTTGATEVSIDNGIGAVAASGSLTVTPTTTTEYTLTATSSGTTASARATVFVDPGDVPIVSVTSFPNGIVQFAGASPTAVEHFSLTNLGRVGTTIQLGKSGDFFTQSPESFALPPGATQVVTITPSARPAGDYRGASLPAGEGVPAGAQIPVRLYVATAPTGTVAPTTAVARTEVAAPANENPSGSVSFTNSGTGTLQGIVTSDVAWLIPQSDPVVIGPGATKEVTFKTNRALRPDASSPAGAAVGTLTLSYITSSGSSSLTPVASDSGSTSASISVTIVDVVKASVVPDAPAPLASGEIALFVPGLPGTVKSSGDLIVSVVGTSIADLRLYLGAPGTSPVLGSLDQIAPNSGLAIPSILKSLFASTASIGTVQARSASLTRVSLAGMHTITSSSIGSYITALPTLRSDRSAAAGEIIDLPGVEKSDPAAMRSTDLVVQEVAGLAGTAKIEVLAASGSVLSSRDEAIAAFALLSIPDAVPPGASAIRVTNTSPTAARIVAYATVVDATTNDGWTIVDPRLISAPSAEYVIAVPPAPGGAIANNQIFLLNPNATPIEIAIDPHSSSRRRAVGPRSGSPTAASVTLQPGQTVRQSLGSFSGFVRMKAAQPFVLSARSEQTMPGRDGVFGSALPALPLSAAMGAGDSRRFGGVDDSSRQTSNLAVPVTYRSSLGLLETSGTAAVVRVTLRYTFSAGNKVSAIGISSANIDVPANRLVVLGELGRSVIGISRDSLGDLRNMQVDVEVVSGGRVLPFVETIDNGSGDSMFRTD